MERFPQINLTDFYSTIKQFISLILKTAIFAISCCILVTNIIRKPSNIFQYLNSTHFPKQDHKELPKPNAL